MEVKDKESDVSVLADMLRRGAKLLSMQCPVCASPLFKLRSGEIWCAKCGKQVVVVKEGEGEAKALSRFLLASIEDTILRKMHEINEKLKDETDVEEVGRFSIVMCRLLETLERIRRISKY